MSLARKVPWLLGSILASGVSWLSAQTRPQEDAPRIAELIGQLGDDAPDRRDAARKELSRLGEAAAPALERAARVDDNPKVRTGSRQLLEAVERTIWAPLLRMPLIEDEEFLRALHTHRVLQVYRERPNQILRIAAETDATLLVERARFFRIRDTAFASGVQPVEDFRIALLKSGRAVLLDADETESRVKHLRRLLAPARNAQAAVKVAILTAKTLIFCPECTPDAVVDPAACAVESFPDGGWNVTIPPNAVAENVNDESAFVSFDIGGRLLSAKQTGHPREHR